MPDEGGKSINIPWTPLLALLAAVAGLTALLPSRSARPPASGAEIAASRGVPARMWQDPMQVANEAEARRKKDPTQSAQLPGLERLRERFNELKSTNDPKSPLVLLMCVPDSPYAEHVERRLRDRAAMHYALSAEGYVPSDSTILDCCLDREGRTCGYAVPFESFVWSAEGKPPKDKPRAILAIWVGDGFLGDKPIQGFARIVASLQPSGCSLVQPPEVRILGPSGSDQYLKILEEIETPPCGRTRQLLSNTRVYSCKATAAEENLLASHGWPAKNTSADAIQAALLNDHLWKDFLWNVCLWRDCRVRNDRSLSFERAVVTDDKLCDALVEEIKQRHIPLDGATSIAVLSEMESFYGRALVRTFRKSVVKGSICCEIGLYEKARLLWAPKDIKLPVIHAYTYMAGIDGALPKNALGVEERTDKDKGATKDATPSLQEPTEGQSQIDYFRRLADMLTKKNDDEIAKGNRGIQVVALLGSDIYDKLQILRTLRHKLPGALFITNDLDARYGHPDEWEETRNLLVASSSSLNIPSLAGETPPPFRDNTQVAVYSATRHALDPLDDHPYEGWRGQSEIFEIGKHGPVKLGGRLAVSQSSLSSNDSFETARRFSVLGIVASLGFLIILQLFRLGKPSNSCRGWHRCRNWSSQSINAVPAAILLSAAITCGRFAAQTENTAEPFAFYDGISIWPGDFLRLVVFLLAVHFVFKTLAILEENVQKLAEEFELDCAHPPPTWDIQQHLKTSSWPYWRRKESSPEPDVVPALNLFKRHRNWGTKRHRIVRTACLLILYVCLIFTLNLFISHSPLPQIPLLPVRGGAAWLSTWILKFAIASTLYVMFLIVDATLLNYRFIRDLDQGRTNWPEPKNGQKAKQAADETKSRHGWYRVSLEPADCADYLDVKYIAGRSDAVNKLIYFPFLLIVLLIAARWSHTDGYPWPSILIVIFVLNATLAGFCSFLLPVGARKARDSNLRRLRDKLNKQRVDEAIHPKAAKDLRSNSVALASVIAEIENLREGAFVGIWEQPLLRAILLPSGGVGLWALLDVLSR